MAVFLVGFNSRYARRTASGGRITTPALIQGSLSRSSITSPARVKAASKTNFGSSLLPGESSTNTSPTEKSSSVGAFPFATQTNIARGIVSVRIVRPQFPLYITVKAEGSEKITEAYRKLRLSATRWTEHLRCFWIALYKFLRARAAGRDAVDEMRTSCALPDFEQAPRRMWRMIGAPPSGRARRCGAAVGERRTT